MTNIKKVIDELANVATTLEFELKQDPVSQPRTAALKRLVAVHRKELNAELTTLQESVPKLERAKGTTTKAKSTTAKTKSPKLNDGGPIDATTAEPQAQAKNSADQQPSDLVDSNPAQGTQPSDVPTE